MDELFEKLLPNPRNPKLGVAELQDSFPSAYTVEFDDAVLVYQILLDHPMIELRQVTWFEDFIPPTH